MAHSVNHLPQSYQGLLAALQDFIPDSRLHTDPLRTLAYGTDASFYRLVPKIVVDVTTEDEVSQIIILADHFGTPLTFRAAGTSLSGQAVSDSVLVRLGWNWGRYRVSHDGSEITLQPGVIGSQANRALARFHRKIGPDPASIDSAMIGGIAANNASGMCCGTAQNSYQTVKSLRVVLADGGILDTGDEASRAAFRHSHSDLIERLQTLGKRVRADTALADRIRNKFKIKNTTGYSLNALIDYEDPFDILQHLMIGSEGTLGFISEITYRTVPDHPCKASALILFPEIRAASAAVTLLGDTPVSAVELMDRASLRSVEDKPGMPVILKSVPEGAAALLVETRAEDAETLAAQVQRITATLDSVTTLEPIAFTDQVSEYTKLWKIRKGLFPAVGAVRDAGTTVVIEDIAVGLERLADVTLELRRLLKKHDYHEAIIFGHALAGNLHFVFTQDFGTPTEVARYRAFMDELCHVIVERYDGSLKAEHGTGRNIAPYLELEWGRAATELMREVKHLFDPQGLLNPGVILNRSKTCHIENLKPLPAADPLVDTCIECGFCEPWCPSRALSLTPRQRIVGLRELTRLRAAKKPERKRIAELEKLYAYDGIDTCAGDGLCSVQCPVDIDTGRMMKVLRGRRMGASGRWAGDRAAGGFGAVATATRSGLATAGVMRRVFGNNMLERISRNLRKVTGNRLPLWSSYMPTGGTFSPDRMVKGPQDGPRVIYFPACVSRMMGPAPTDPEKAALPEKTAALFAKAGYHVILPKGCDDQCCGVPFESKGLAKQADASLASLEQTLKTASRNGQDLIVCDTTLCSHRLKQAGTLGLPVMDIIDFIHDHLLDRLPLTQLPETIAIHATCSSIKLGTAEKLKAIAMRCAEDVIIPESVTCCGWAGDKGFLVPELNASALRDLKGQIPERCVAGYSTSRTCEIGLSMHSDRFYRSIVYLVNRASAFAEVTRAHD